MADVGLKLYRNADFSGGLNDWADSYNLAPNEAISATNCLLDSAGALVRRSGIVAYGTTPQTAAWAEYAGLGLFRAYWDYTQNLTDYTAGEQLAKALIGKLYGTIYYGTDADGAGTSLGGGCTTTARIRCCQWGDTRIYIAIADGNHDHDHAKRWGGTIGTPTSVQRMSNDMGVSIPTGTVAGTAAGGTACALTPLTVNCYLRWAETITYGPLGAWGESLPNYSVAYNHTGAGKHYAVSGLMDITAWQTSHGAYQKKVYCSLAQTTLADAKAAPCYYVGTVAAATTTFEFEPGDNVLDVTDPAPTAADTGDIPCDYARIFVQHNNRLWAVWWGTNTSGNMGFRDRVYYSNLNMPDEWPAANYIEVMGEITGLWSAPFGLMIGTKHSWYLMSGWGLADFSGSIQTLKGLPGCVGFDTVAQITMNGTQVVVWAGEDGIYGYDGQQVIILGRTADGKSQKIQGTWKNHVTSAVKANARAVAWKDYYLIAFDDDRETAATNSAVNNRVLLYDIRYDAWFTITGWNVGGWCVWNGMTDSDELYFIDGTSHADSTTKGFIYHAFTGASENSVMDWQSGYLPLGGEATSKVFRKIYIELDTNYLPIDVYLYLDRALRTSDNLAITDPPTGYESNCVPKNVNKGMIGKRVAIRFYKVSTTAFKIFGYRLGYRFKGTGRV